MSALVVRAYCARKLRLLSGFARATSVVLTVIDLFAEAQHLADEARQRYQFVDE